MPLLHSEPSKVEFADKSMEAISYYAIQASCDLAEERGSYSTFEGCLLYTSRCV